MVIYFLIKHRLFKKTLHFIRPQNSLFDKMVISLHPLISIFVLIPCICLQKYLHRGSSSSVYIHTFSAVVRSKIKFDRRKGVYSHNKKLTLCNIDTDIPF